MPRVATTKHTNTDTTTPYDIKPSSHQMSPVFDSSEIDLIVDAFLGIHPAAGIDSAQEVKPATKAIAKAKARAKAQAQVKDTTPTKSGAGGYGKTGRPWTAEEKALIFETVIKKGANVKSFEGLVEGRTGRQCYMSWHNTFEPAIKRFLLGT